MEPKPQFADAAIERQDREHLQLLSILYYVLAGLSALGGCFPVIHLTVGLAMLGGASGFPGEPEGRVAFGFIGGFFTIVAALMIVLLWTQAFLLYCTARNLAERRSHLFCMVVACITCLSVPVGTALGVFTIIVLQRDSVKQLFGVSTADPFSAAPRRY
ncbi:hypothetical protein NA78x_000012 [Anatilimnocola sp. NA78]|uniref:hypothetical protein n=1 Tax=Anatilimnocola sp. NA78 TaxID=3415683 RepID=UPI003CE5932E